MMIMKCAVSERNGNLPGGLKKFMSWANWVNLKFSVSVLVVVLILYKSSDLQL